MNELLAGYLGLHVRIYLHEQCTSGYILLFSVAAVQLVFFLASEVVQPIGRV